VVSRLPQPGRFLNYRCRRKGWSIWEHMAFPAEVKELLLARQRNEERHSGKPPLSLTPAAEAAPVPNGDGEGVPKRSLAVSVPVGMEQRGAGEDFSASGESKDGGGDEVDGLCQSQWGQGGGVGRRGQRIRELY
jgi:hypothetical protein